MKETPTLRWGDIIRIHGVKLSRVNREKEKGLIISKGFTDPKIYYQKYSSFKKVNFYRESLFQIMPRGNFDVHDQLDLDQSAQNRETLKSRAKGQIDGIYNILSLKAGEEVLYGADVVFKHISSDSFMRGFMIAADSGDGAFTIQVCKDLSSQIVWKICSHRTYQHEGDPIYYNDELLIYHSVSDCFMNFVESGLPIELDEKIEQSPDRESNEEEFSNLITIKKPFEHRISVINENKNKCLWKFKIHCDYKSHEYKDLIKSHDIVYFRHTKKKGLIATSLRSPSYMLKEIEGAAISYDCLWELIPIVYHNQETFEFHARNIITGLLLKHENLQVRVKPRQKMKGGGCKNQSLIELICSKEEELLDRGERIPQDRTKAPIVQSSEELYTLYSLKSVKTLTEDGFQIIRVPQIDLYNVQYVLSAHEPVAKFIEVFSNYLRRADQPKRADQRKRADQLKAEYDEEGRNKLMQTSLNSPLKKNLSRSSKSSWQKTSRVQIAPTMDFKTLKLESLTKIKDIFEMLAGHIYGTSYSHIQGSGNTANETVQKILVQTGTTDLVMEIITLLQESVIFIRRNEDASDDRAQRFRISELFERAYVLLEHIGRGNTTSKIYLARWVDVLLDHFVSIDEIYVQKCLLCILKNNPSAIRATVHEHKIKQLINTFFDEAKDQKAVLTTKYLILFSTLIRCKPHVLKYAQDVILTEFFMNFKNERSFKFKISEREVENELMEGVQNESMELPFFLSFQKVRQKRVEVALGKQDFTSIVKFFRDMSSKWDYFLAYVSLLADVCMERNQFAIENVSALISLEIVTAILLDPQIHQLNKQIYEENSRSLLEKGTPKYPIPDIHDPFLRIAHFAYVCNEKFSVIQRIHNVHRWHEHSQKNEDINKTNRLFLGEKEENERQHLRCVLKYIHFFLRSYQPEKLQILLRVLSLLKDTIELGLWESISQLNQLIPLLIQSVIKIEKSRFFRCTQEMQSRYTAQEIVTLNKAGLALSRDDVHTAIRCNLVATEIFERINELQIDINIRQFMNFFKGIYEATIKFDAYSELPVENLVAESDVLHRNLIAESVSLKSSNTLLVGLRKVGADQEIICKENLWYNKIKELTPTPQPSKDPCLGSSFESMILSLLELPLYGNEKLLGASLRMLRSLFEKRNAIICGFKKILICGKGSLNELFETVKSMRVKFNALNKHDLAPYCLQKKYDFSEKKLELRSGILQDLHFLSKTMLQGCNIKNIEQLMTVEEESVSFLSEKDVGNRLFQSMNLAWGLYVPLIEYISKHPEAEEHTLLVGMYRYLTVLCFNNLEAKQLLMPHLSSVLPHLGKKVGAANFIYQVSLNNQLLISDSQLVESIIDNALLACIFLCDSEQSWELSYKEDEASRQYPPRESFAHKKGPYQPKDYEMALILFSLRGLLLFNDQGYQPNQQILINRFQDNKFKRLIFKSPITRGARRGQEFGLNPEEAYIGCHFELFGALVESRNFINIGKLENIHPYPYLLQCLKNTPRLELQRSIRAYLNRLYYANKERDIFMFEEFIRREFKLINEQFGSLIYLHKNKQIHDEVPLPNGVRFHFAHSEVLMLLIQICITLHEMLNKQEFLRVLGEELKKEKTSFQKQVQVQLEVHEQLSKLVHHMGCINILYPAKSIVAAFIHKIFEQLCEVMADFPLAYVEKQLIACSEQLQDDQEDLGQQNQRINSYVYDNTKTFFKNLSNMIRALKAKEKRDEYLSQRAIALSGDLPENKIAHYIRTIYRAKTEKLKPIVHRSHRETTVSAYAPHTETINPLRFRISASVTLTEDEQNEELNKRLAVVKEITQDSPLFRLLREKEFYRLVDIFANVDEVSRRLYEPYWQAIGEKRAVPVLSLREVLSLSFKLIIQSPQEIDDAEKIFVLKLARRYITEAVEGKQIYKLPVDKWDAEYYPGEKDSEFEARQQLIQECGGSDFIISIFRENATTLHSKVELLNQTLLFGIAYLFNGNKVCQNSLRSALAIDHDNAMLLSIRKLMNLIGGLLIEMRSLKEQREVKEATGILGFDRHTSRSKPFAYNIVDTYDHYDSKTNMIQKNSTSGRDKVEAQTESNCELALRRMFRLLQLFCENGNVETKKFLLIQTDENGEGKTNSINFLQVTTLLLRKLFKVMNKNLVSIPEPLLDFINEATQLPCIRNQISLMKSTFFEDISYLAGFFAAPQNLLARQFSGKTSDPPTATLLSIFQKAIDLALGNLQGNDHILFEELLNKCQPKFLWFVIRQNLLSLLIPDKELEDTEINVIDVFAQFDLQAIKQYIAGEEAHSSIFSEGLCNILNVIYILKKLSMYSEQVQGADKQAKAVQFREECVQFGSEQYPHFGDFLSCCEQLVLSIEVSSFNGRSDTLQEVYFPAHPLFKYLGDRTKDSIMMQVKRDTQRDKLISLLELREEVYEEIHLNYSLKHGQIGAFGYRVDFPITSNYSATIREQARYLSHFICFLLLFLIVVDHDVVDMASAFNYRDFISQALLTLICAGQLLFTFWYLYVWMRLRLPLALKKLEHEKKSMEEKKAEECSKKTEMEMEGWQILAEWMMDWVCRARGWLGVHTSVLKEWMPVKYSIVALLALHRYEPDFLSMLLFVTTSLLGNFVRVEWYSVHLFDIFMNKSELTNIFKAILNNLQKLALLTLLAIAFVLVFNVLSFSTYSPFIYEPGESADACSSIRECVLQLYTSEVIMDNMSEFNLKRFVFDIMYVVFMEMLFKEIVGGIMIDSFMSLKEEDEMRDEDKSSKCYICGETKPNMEKSGTTFQKHKEKHLLWNYFYFLYCLKSKSSTDFTGLEYSIYLKHFTDETTWFPAVQESDDDAKNDQLMLDLQTEVHAYTDLLSKPQCGTQQDED